MEFTPGCTTALLTVQKIFSLPLYIRAIPNGEHTSIKNPLYNSRVANIFGKQLHYPMHAKLIWKYIKYIMILHVIYGFVKAIDLFQRWSNFADFEHLGHCCLLITLGGIGYSAYSAVDAHLLEIIYLLNQRFQLVFTNKQSTILNTKKFKHFASQTLVFLFVFGFLAFPILLPLVVILRPYNPVELTVRLVYSLFSRSASVTNQTTWYIKIVTVVCVFLVTYHAAAIVLLFLLWLIIMLEMVIRLSERLATSCSNRFSFLNEFQRKFMEYKILQILVRYISIAIEDF